ncbi:MAG: rhodanese-like domain-containing protein [Pirellula sp.]|jgi:rhodanese-related sulfurtransferase|nr:rhodanese-like domain-containing protein [Pirellula sp.]
MFSFRKSSCLTVTRLLTGLAICLSVLVGSAQSIEQPKNARDEPKKSPLTHTQDSLDEVKKAVASGKAVLVDVRELVEWKSGHIKGAVHLPFRAMQEKIDAQKIKDDFKNKIVYTYCAVGMRSLKAGQILTKLDLDIRPLKPGYDELVKAGFEKE